MIDASQGWGITDRAVFTTADGGRSWGRALSISASTGPAVADFYSTKDAWVAASAPEGSLTVYRTTDGGTTWSQSSISLRNAVPRFIMFIDPAHGWLWVSDGAAAGSEAGTLLATTDGAAHWTTIADANSHGSGAIPFSGFKDGFRFTTASDGWMVIRSSNAGAAWLYTTHDGGRTWSKVSSVPPAAHGWILDYVRTPVVSGTTILLPVQWVAADQHQVANPFQWVFYVSHDAGGSWGPTQPTCRYFLSFSFLSPLDGVAVANGNVETTADGGATWQSFAPSHPANHPLVGDVRIDFVSQTVDFAIIRTHKRGEGNALLMTRDGGHTWYTVAGSGRRPMYKPR